MSLLEVPVIELDTVDSTNNYAMRAIDADTAQHGLTIIAQSQTQGKGQRGKTWLDNAGDSILMTIIVMPHQSLEEQFAFNCGVATSIANVLQNLDSSWQVRVKWPNDIIVNDKKAGGILIENVLRGSKWTYSVIGLGLNVKQRHFPEELPYATSLKIASGKDVDINDLKGKLREAILSQTSALTQAGNVMKQYNELLYRKGQEQSFIDERGTWNAIIVQAQADGTLLLQHEDGSVKPYHHGQVLWNWK